MKKTWILVAQQAGMRVFEHSRHGDSPKLIETRMHPDGARKNQEIDSDRPGRTFCSANSGGGAFTHEVDAHQHKLQVFAKEIAQFLENGLNQHCYENLVLVAEPRFLGIVRESLDKKVLDTVSATLNKDLAHFEGVALQKYLCDAIGL